MTNRIAFFLLGASLGSVGAALVALFGKLGWNE